MQPRSGLDDINERMAEQKKAAEKIKRRTEGQVDSDDEK